MSHTLLQKPSPRFEEGSPTEVADGFDPALAANGVNQQL